MTRIAILFSLLFLLCQNALQAQLLTHVQGELLVQFKPTVNPQKWVQRWQTFEGKPTQMKLGKEASKPLRIWRVNFDFAQIPEAMLLEAVRRSPDVAIAQYNHLVRMRSTIPDDPGFPQQWQYMNTGQTGGTADADIDMDLAWDITTGGLTAQGDTIVVCAVDDGLDLTHQDFGDNLWINHGEIPDNDIDDDGNGYVDDYRGWSIISDSDNISGGGHGTPVAGIMGAKGNNARGVAGVSWNIKLMIVKNNFNTNEAAVLEAYSYPLIQRMIYNETHGEKGAFVVAANSSWGTDFGDPADAPLWCSFYDTLGVHGIVSCGATTNSNTNVDVQGDLPTACSSDYLIAVTNMNHNDVKVTSAGYGATTIDLGAFGANTWTTAQGNSYAPFGGTSGATPHVTGAIGLLYSAPCPSFIAIAKSDPAAGALLAKQYILQGVDPNASLAGITTTGGRLNVFNSLNLLMQGCSGCPPPTSVNTSNITAEQATISWNLTDSINTVDLLWRIQGDTTWQLVPGVVAPYMFDSLLACTTYEIQLQGYCNTDTSELFNVYTFKTDGCCVLPADFSVVQTTDESAIFTWSNVLAANSFNIRYKNDTATDWIELTAVGGNSAAINGLTPCTNYEVQISASCDTIFTGYSPSALFRTLGCGACLDLPYCADISLNASEEWINLVELADLNNPSGSNDGYGNFTDTTTTVLEQGGLYNLKLQPGYSGVSYQEYFKIWIDYNKDAQFEDSEVVFDANGTTNALLEEELQMPADAPLGVTRMRVVMNYQSVEGTCDFASDAYGEVEDYCVEVVPTSNCAAPAAIDTLTVDYYETKLSWDYVGPALNYLIRYRELGQSNWDSLNSTASDILLSQLSECTEYEVQISTLCSQSFSDFGDTLRFRTDCITSTRTPASTDFEWNLMPNPFRDELTIVVGKTENNTLYLLEYFDALGQRLGQQNIQAAEISGRNGYTILTSTWKPGLYLVKITDAAGKSSVRKVVKG